MELGFPLLLDGATGTELQKRGFGGSEAAESWVLRHSEAIREIQKGYLDAGSQVLYTPTFGANRVKLEQYRIFNQVKDYNLRLAALSRETAAGRALVAGDIAPTGEFLYPLGELQFEELVEIYREQAAALEEAGVDLFVIETMMTLPEARAAVLAVREVSRKPIFVTMTCDENGRTLTGTDVVAALTVLQGMGIDAFGLNCSTGPDAMLRQLQRLTPYAEIPLIAKPNAGVPEMVNGETRYNCGAEEFVKLTGEMAAAGVQIFGGCCGTEASHIAALREAIKGLQMRDPAPEYSDLLPCATEKDACYLPATAAYESVITCSDELEDDIMDAMGDDGELLAIKMQSEADLDEFAQVQYLIRKPLCILCEDAALLEQALRLYQGRALYEGSLSDEVLFPLVRKYGLII